MIVNTLLCLAESLFAGRWCSVYGRMFLVWRKLAYASILGNVVDPLITLVAFGYGLGRLIEQVEGVPYIIYLLAGSICMSSMMAASFEALYSAFSRMHNQKTWETILNAPIRLEDVLIAEWLWAASKGLMSGVAIILVGLALGLAHSWTVLLIPLVVFLLTACFAAIALCFNALAKGYEFFTCYFTLVLTPTIFLSGVYFPMQALPTWLAPVPKVLPLASAVDLVRPLVLGRWPEQVVQPLLILLAYTVVGLVIATILTKRRFKS